ncbi:MAG: hypothetical protein GY847_14300 [Proteobacteria bacterium]|nr:hypothetical protein [Pseudomonadota bacterium]
MKKSHLAILVITILGAGALYGWAATKTGTYRTSLGGIRQMVYPEVMLDGVTYHPELVGVVNIPTASAGATPLSSVYVESLNSTAASAAVIMIDRTDTTNFLHSNTTTVIIDNISVQTVLPGDTGRWIFRWGVVEKVGANDSKIAWFYSTLFDAEQDGMQYNYTGPAINTTLDGGTLKYLGTAVRDANHASYGTADTTATFFGTTPTIDEGDIVLELEELLDGATLSSTFTITYHTE